MEVSTVISLLGLVMVVAVTLINLFKDKTASGKEQGSITNDVKYLVRTLDDMRVEQRVLSKKWEDTSKQVIIAHESAKQAHRRIDELVSKK